MHVARKKCIAMRCTLIFQPMTDNVHHHDPVSLQRSWKVQLKCHLLSGSIIMTLAHSSLLWHKETYCAAFCIKSSTCNRVAYVTLSASMCWSLAVLSLFLEYVLTLNIFKEVVCRTQCIMFPQQQLHATYVCYISWQHLKSMCNDWSLSSRVLQGQLVVFLKT